MMKVEATAYGDRKVFSVSAFNRGISTWLQRLPTVWVEGEVTELKRHERWQSVFFTLKDPTDGACLGVSMPRGQFDGLRLELADGDRVHAYGRPELYAARGEFRLRALSLERFGLGDHLAALERLKRQLASEGVFAAERKRALPVWPRKIGLITGNDAAAKRDVLTGIQTRFPPAHVVVAETYVQGPRAAGAVTEALRRLCELPELDVVVVARGGGSLGRGARRSLELKVARLGQAHERLGRAPALLVERRRAALEQAAGRLRALSPKATLRRGYAIVRAGETIVRSIGAAETGERIDVEVSDGRFGARVE